MVHIGHWGASGSRAITLYPSSHVRMQARKALAAKKAAASKKSSSSASAAAAKEAKERAKKKAAKKDTKHYNQVSACRDAICSPNKTLQIGHDTLQV